MKVKKESVRKKTLTEELEAYFDRNTDGYFSSILTEGVLEIIIKKLDEEIKNIMPKHKTKEWLELIRQHEQDKNICMVCSFYTLKKFKSELEECKNELEK